jgi:ribosomal protein L11 methyltransferase
MAWLELVTAPIPRERIEPLSAKLFALGAAGVQEDLPAGVTLVIHQPWDDGPPPAPPTHVILRAWYEDPDASALRAALPGLSFNLTDLEERDWAEEWKANFPPLVVSPRLRIAPPWCAEPGDVIIEPGQGFGTGQHPTTLGALRAVDRLAESCATALDVGCGSGVLALAAAKFGCVVGGVDIDGPSIEEAHANAVRNDVDADFSTRPVRKLTEPADLVLANLFAEVLVELAPHLQRLTRKYLVLAGILAEREAKVRAAFDGAMTLSERETDGEWILLIYTP